MVYFVICRENDATPVVCHKFYVIIDRLVK